MTDRAAAGAAPTKGVSMARVTAEEITAWGTLADMVLTLLGKRPKAKKAIAAFGKNKAMVDDYVTGCEKLQAAADAGEDLGSLTVGEVKAIAMADDLLVKAARKVQKKLATA